MKRKKHIEVFVHEIWQWYARHKRTLPWRDLRVADHTQRAYQVLVSEIMLQQTQVSRVIVKYKEFLERFPTILDLANASNKDVILAWQGMGYNSRALRLRDAARYIVESSTIKDEGSKFSTFNLHALSECNFPTSMQALQSLPGIGHYTAAAIRNFAFGLPTPCIDTNIRRILHRSFIGPENVDGIWRKNDQYLLKLAEKVLEAALNNQDEGIKVKDGDSASSTFNLQPSSLQSTADWHAALMDFGSLVCTKRSPKWDICPLTKQEAMKAAYKAPRNRGVVATSVSKREPGRFVGSVYIPNRIFRGKIVEELRNQPTGLPLEKIGTRVCLDWKSSEHKLWLQTIIQKLIQDRLLEQKGKYYAIAE